MAALNYRIRETKPSLLLIGIGGPSSSGKTTLARTLTLLLRDAAIVAARGTTAQGQVDGRAGAPMADVVTLFSQDEYFIPAAEQTWPLIAIPGKAPQQWQPSPSPPPPDPAEETWSVGVDRDCIECVRFQDLLDDIRLVRRWDDPRCELPREPIEDQAVEILADALANRRSAGSGSGAGSVAVVEGNLVLARQHYDHPTPPPPPPPLLDATAIADHPAATSPHVLQSRQAQEELRTALHVKILLACDEETVCRRRFARAEYRDRTAENPLGRIPEMHWRMDWYFAHVWSRYEQYHEYVLRPSTEPEYLATPGQGGGGGDGQGIARVGIWDTQVVEGVYVRPGSVSTPEDTALWAAHVVAYEMGIRKWDLASEADCRQ